MDEDVWGKPYQMVMKRTRLAIPITPPENLVEKIVRHLFPVRKEVNEEDDEGEENPMYNLEKPFTEGEIQEAATRLKNRKAPGSD